MWKVAMMRQHGVIVVNEASLSLKIDSGEEIVKGSEEEVCLRARALIGVEMIVSKLNNTHSTTTQEETGNIINSQRLCNWLWVD
jgi:hypothetical protein